MKESRLTTQQQQAFLEMFQDLVCIESASDDNVDPDETSPTTEGQLLVVQYLEPVLKEMGLQDVEIDDKGYLTGILPGNLTLPADQIPTVGLVAHADTNAEGKAEDGSAPNPKVIICVGEDIYLGDSGEVIRVADNPHLTDLAGQPLVVSDGKSLIGGDDKAGIVEIIFALRHLIDHPEIKRPHIKVAVVCDEEIGGQVRHFTRTEGDEDEDKVTTLDRDKWDVNQAYTMDGGQLGEYSVETFNASRATVTITGKLTHPAEGKKKGLLNACTLSMHFLELLDRQLMPCERSEGREPHTTVLAMNGNMVKMAVTILLRGFEENEIRDQQIAIDTICDSMNELFPDGSFQVDYKNEYKNMVVYLAERSEIEELLIKAIEMQGLTPEKEAIRGGTDGSRLSELGCPCPNVFTGTMNMHARTEHLVLSWAYQAVEVLINLMELWGERAEFVQKHG